LIGRAPSTIVRWNEGKRRFELLLVMSDIDQHYRALGLPPGAPSHTIKQAYRDLVKVWHPDRFSNDPRLQQKAQEELKAINIAYHALIGQHDERHSPHFTAPPPTPPKPSEPQQPSRQSTRSTAFKPGTEYSSPAPAAATLNPAVYVWFFRVSKILAVLLTLNLLRLLAFDCGAD
jgi:hypothetical protein